MVNPSLSYHFSINKGRDDAWRKKKMFYEEKESLLPSANIRLLVPTKKQKKDKEKAFYPFIFLWRAISFVWPKIRRERKLMIIDIKILYSNSLFLVDSVVTLVSFFFFPAKYSVYSSVIKLVVFCFLCEN